MSDAAAVKTNTFSSLVASLLILDNNYYRQVSV